MAKIVDPDDLFQSTVSIASGGQTASGAAGNVYFNTALKEIELLNSSTVPTIDYGTGSISNALSKDGSTIQALYSFAKEEWKDDNELIKYAFPFIAITAEQFELTNSWDFHDNISQVVSAGGTTADATLNLMRDAGWALKDAGGISEEEYMNITSLGSFDDSATDQAYYLQVDGGTPISIVLPGEVNQSVKIYGDSTHGNFDYRQFFKIYLREQAKIYGFGDLIVDQALSVLTYRKYAVPLTNSADIKITNADSAISIGGTVADQTPYDGMSITYYLSPQDRDIGGTTYSFSIIIDGNTATAEQIYEFSQWSLRQAFDIDAGAGSVRGDTAEELLAFVGDTLRTQLTSDGGVFIDNFSTVDTNRLEFTDDSGSVLTFPFVAAGSLLFNENLTGDNEAKYWVFYTYTNFITGADISISNASGFTGTLTDGGAEMATFSYLDYVSTSGFTNEENNGIFQVIATPSATTMSISKVDEETIVDEGAGQTVIVGDNPYGSPNAIVLNDNIGIPITGSVSDAVGGSIAYDYDYDNNTQGGRIRGTNAVFTAVSLGLAGGQYVVTTGTLTRSTTNNINFVAALERNYSNP